MLHRNAPPTFILLAAAALLAGGCTAPAPDLAPLTAKQQALNVESFDQAWQAVADTYWEEDFDGVDWPGARDELRPQVADAENMRAARQVFNNLIARLGKTHFAIVPKEVYANMDEADDDPETETRPDEDGETGMELRIVDGVAVVTRVYPDSPADLAGIAPGWIVAAIDDDPVEPIVSGLAEAYRESLLCEAMQVRAIQSRLQRAIGESVNLSLRDGSDEPVAVNLTLLPKRGHKSRFGNMPEEYVWLETEIIDGDIAYFALNLFLDAPRVMNAYGTFVTEHMDAAGLVIDLRGNPGGLGVMAMAMAGWLVDDKSQYLGTMNLRDADLKFVINPRLETYGGPVVVLIDGLSASTSEILAGGLKDIGRAHIVGTQTAGAALPSQFKRLANGDAFQFAMANYVSASGAELEGAGVVPDSVLPLNRAALLAGQDAALDTAIAWIRSGGDSETKTTD